MPADGLGVLAALVRQRVRLIGDGVVLAVGSAAEPRDEQALGLDGHRSPRPD
ncbi:hypothetical protein [Amycolatopsis palatopharyngis]|uniref:hypothetical protein n=1 Tax=Amycolatopsis palatopharyngis TaxID=187982 RepID=UPI0013BE9DB7|nr:hypothetical protein [Amycolatopsis palatopharyngis]